MNAADGIETLNLWRDGIAGRRLALTEHFEYAEGRTQEGGEMGCYRRPASHVGTYGGWRWEAYTPDRLIVV